MGFVATGALVFALMWLTRGAAISGGGSEPLLLPGTNVGEQMAPFTATTLDGKAMSFPSDFKGKIVLLDFWATWCGPCVASMPELKRIYTKYRNSGFEIVGVSLDGPNGVSAESLDRFLRGNEITWPQIYANVEPLATQFGIVAIPTAYLIDGESGHILARGVSLDGGDLEKRLKLLKLRGE